MQSPASFNVSSRNSLMQSISNAHAISLHSYETAQQLGAAQGSLLLANAVQDETRSNKPENFNAIVIYAIENTAEKLASKLNAVNKLCPLPCFLNAKAIAKSLETLNTDKFTVTTGQSIEWQVINDIRAIPALNKAFNDSSLSLVNNESKTLVSDITTSISELKTLKTARDQRLSNTAFISGNLGLKTAKFTSDNSQSLANNIATLGNNDQHWAYVIFVGNNEQLSAIEELFL